MASPRPPPTLHDARRAPAERDGGRAGDEAGQSPLARRERARLADAVHAASDATVPAPELAAPVPGRGEGPPRPRSAQAARASSEETVPEPRGPAAPAPRSAPAPEPKGARARLAAGAKPVFELTDPIALPAPAPRPDVPALDSKVATSVRPQLQAPPQAAAALDSRAETAVRPRVGDSSTEDELPVPVLPPPPPAAPPPPPGAGAMIGAVLAGEFRVLSKLGEGGFGTVFLADQLGAGGVAIRRVVVKTVRPTVARSEEVLARFHQEARILASLSHPSVVTLYRYGRLDDGQLFIAMEHGGDRDLAAELRAVGRLGPARALRIAERVCDALQVAHRSEIIHRDLKPANILLSRDDEERVKVVDLGIAKLVRELSADAASPTVGTLTGANVFVGSAAYASPEQAEGAKVDERSDLYSLGVVLYEMLVGHLPVRGGSVQALLLAHYGMPPIPPAQFGVTLPAPVQAVLDKALAKKREARFQTAREMREALVAAREALVAAREALAAPQAVPPPARAARGAGRAALVAVGVVVAVGALAGLGIRLSAPPAPEPAGVAAERAAAPTEAAPAPAPGIVLEPQDAEIAVVVAGRTVRNPSVLPIEGDSGDFQIVPAFGGFRILAAWRREEGRVRLSLSTEPRAMIREGPVRMGIQHEVALGAQPVLLGFKPLGSAGGAEFVLKAALREAR